MLDKKMFGQCYLSANKCCGYLGEIPIEILKMMYESVKTRFTDEEFNSITVEVVADCKCYNTWLPINEWTSRKKEIHTYFEGMKRLHELGRIDDNRMLEIYKEFPDKAIKDGVNVEQEEQKLLTKDDAKDVMARLKAISFIKSIDNQNESK